MVCSTSAKLSKESPTLSGPNGTTTFVHAIAVLYNAFYASDYPLPMLGYGTEDERANGSNSKHRKQAKLQQNIENNRNFIEVET